jgi:hypothetical protein
MNSKNGTVEKDDLKEISIKSSQRSGSGIGGSANVSAFTDALYTLLSKVKCQP